VARVLGSARSLEEEWPQLVISEPSYRAPALEIHTSESCLDFDYNKKGKYAVLDIKK